MKPADFFLGARQLFAFMLPGLVWLASSVLLLSPLPLQGLLKGVLAMNAAGWVCVLAAALVLGIAAQKCLLIAYECANRRWLPDAEMRALLMNATDRLAAGYASAGSTFRQPNNEWRILRAVFTDCKRILIERESPLAAHILNIDAELNALGLLPVPIAVLGAMLMWRVGEFAALGYSRGRPWIASVLLMMTGASVWGLLYMFRLVLVDEVRASLASFLVYDGLANGISRTNSVAGGHSSDTPEHKGTAPE